MKEAKRPVIYHQRIRYIAEPSLIYELDVHPILETLDFQRYA